jgi:hypothetical protein
VVAVGNYCGRRGLFFRPTPIKALSRFFIAWLGGDLPFGGLPFLPVKGALRTTNQKASFLGVSESGRHFSTADAQCLQGFPMAVWNTAVILAVMPGPHFKHQASAFTR